MAAGYYKQFVLTRDVRHIQLAGKISLSSSAAVTTIDVPQVASVVKTGTGAYTITLSTPFVHTRALQFTAASATQYVGVHVTSDTTSNAASPQITIVTTVAGAAADVTSATDIHAILVFKDSGVPS